MLMTQSRHKKKLVILFLIFFIIGAALGIIAASPKSTLEKRSSPATIVPKPSVESSQRTMLQGEIVCLPHKDTSGPQTMECAYGIKTENGDHYVLDTGMMTTVPTGYDTGDVISANGIITPIERLSTDQWMKYDVKGIFSVTDSFEKL